MNENSALQTVVVPRTRDLGDGFEVRRALPTVERRMVGPFVFLDQMGPARFAAGHGLDVRPHPHIGLATLTYLYDGEILHRDSLGVVQPIRAGAVNWMTAGRGIVHSERSAPEVRAAGSALEGLQLWVALPKRDEECEPSFVHHPADTLPVIDGDGVCARIVAGECFGRRSPVETRSPLVFADLTLQPGARVDIPALHAEQALYVVDGRLDLGADGAFDGGRLLVLKPGAPVALRGAASGPTRCVLLGGEPMDGPRYLAWNFVASSAERIEQAKADWKAGRFPAVPGETEFIPVPDLPGRPVSWP